MNKSNVDFSYVDLKDGFWKSRYDLNRLVSLDAVYDRFKETYRIKAMLYTFKEGDILDPYFASDVAKWIEAVAYLIIKNPNEYKKEEKIIDEMVAAIQKNLTDGYLNPCYQQVAKEKKLKDRQNHELYTLGHLIEAAIAYDIATQKDTFLKCCEKSADYIQKVFIEEKSAGFITDGHEEIELALIKLYLHTGKRKYLDLGLHFINVRGCEEESCLDFANPNYDQHDRPIREIETAEGHAVRAVYIYIAMVEAGIESSDQKLIDAAKRAFDNIINKRMYITGGIGSSRLGECFTSDYDLPNLYAYSESCAAIGLLLLCLSLQKTSDESIYSDIAEKVLYNNLLSSTSLDGKAFFYENPLEISLDEINKEKSIKESFRTVLPMTQRKRVFGCSCCPPNINRIFARIADVIFSENDDTLFLNQFITCDLSNGKIAVEIQTQYPNSGEVLIDIKRNSRYKFLKVRKPAWCGKVIADNHFFEHKGYMVFNIGQTDRVKLRFEINSYFMQSNPRVRDNNGRVALLRGPVVYCLESVDNGGNIGALSVDIASKPELVFNEKYNLFDIFYDGCEDCGFEELYKKADGLSQKKKLRFTPYFTFANRGENNMQVFVRKK